MPRRSRQKGYDTEICPSTDAALTIAEKGCEIIITAVRGPETDGLEMLRRLRARRPDVAVILLAADSSVTSAAAAMHYGAFDYVTKPFIAEALVKTVARAIAMGSLQRENHRLRQQLDVASTAAGFIAESPQSKQLVAMIRRVAPSGSTTLIEGESGTGKELVARMLHYWSGRAPTGHSSRSTARHSPTAWSKANCSATRKARLPARSPRARMLRARVGRHPVP